MSKRYSRFIRMMVSIGGGTLFLFAVSSGAFAQNEDSAAVPADPVGMTDEAVLGDGPVMATLGDVETVQTNLDMTWILLAGFLVFFMQSGFAMLEGGFIRQTGVVNSMVENFMDTAVTGLVFFLVGYGIAYASPETSTFFGTPTFALGGIQGTAEGDGVALINFFFQFAFAGAAATIATGSMAERTDFRGKLLYSVVVAAIIYPLVVFWTWGTGFLYEAGFLDFAGSGIVHLTGGIIALVGAIVVGPRAGRVFGKAPRPSNLMLATLGTFILWFGWYGFNVGSGLGTSNTNQLGLVAVTTTLSACAASVSAMFYVYLTKGGKWDLGMVLNGALAGLVGVTAGCAFVSPAAALIIGTVAGVVVVLAMDALEKLKIDDAVGAFAVHGACGTWGVIAVGLFGIEELTGSTAGLLMGGGFELMSAQLLALAVIITWTAITSFITFKAIDMLGLLRVSDEGLAVGIDLHEHGAIAWPSVLTSSEDEDLMLAPAAGD